MELFWHAPSKFQIRKRLTHHTEPLPQAEGKPKGRTAKAQAPEAKKFKARNTGEKNKNMQASLQQQATDPVRHALYQPKATKVRLAWTHVFSPLVYKIDQVRLLTIEVHLFTD